MKTNTQGKTYRFNELIRRLTVIIQFSYMAHNVLYAVVLNLKSTYDVCPKQS